MELNLMQRGRGLKERIRTSVSNVRTAAADQFAELLLWLGAACIATGVAMIHVPAGVITLGLTMVVGGVVIARATGGS